MNKNLPYIHVEVEEFRMEEEVLHSTRKERSYMPGGKVVPSAHQYAACEEQAPFQFSIWLPLRQVVSYALAQVYNNEVYLIEARSGWN
jgi:hypothetical protein